MPMFAGGGFGAGLALGLGIGLLMEMHDTSLRSEHDVEVILRLPVLAMIPVIAPNMGRVKPQPSLPTTYKTKVPAKV
jgi:ABC-type nitrate/sulfonate/bicarbonate transport system permease component